MSNSAPPFRSTSSAGALNVVACCASEELAHAFREQARLLPDVAARVELRHGRRAGEIVALDGQVLILDIDLAKAGEFDLLTEVLARRGAGRPLVATAAQADVAQVRQLMRLGVADFLPQPIVHTELEHSLRGLMPRLEQKAQGGKAGAIVTFLRPVGGAGATTLATHTALALAKPNRRVALLDLDLQHGAAALYLDIKTNIGVVNCLDRYHDLEPGLIKSVAVKHESGVDVIVATPNRRPLDDYPPQAVELLLDTASRIYDIVVVDTPVTWTQWHGPLLAHSDVAAIVVQKSVGNLRCGRELITAVRDAQLRPDQILTVCNRVPQSWFSRDISHADAERALGAKIDVAVPSDYALVSEAGNLGVPVARIKAGSKFEKAVGMLAAEIERRIAHRHESVSAAPAADAAAHNPMTPGAWSNDAQPPLSARG